MNNVLEIYYFLENYWYLESYKSYFASLTT